MLIRRQRSLAAPNADSTTNVWSSTAGVEAAPLLHVSISLLFSGSLSFPRGTRSVSSPAKAGGALQKRRKPPKMFRRDSQRCHRWHRYSEEYALKFRNWLCRRRGRRVLTNMNGTVSFELDFRNSGRRRARLNLNDFWSNIGKRGVYYFYSEGERRRGLSWSRKHRKRNVF